MQPGGVIPIVQTPFDIDEAMDWPSLEREVAWAFEHGADGIGTGMVSELLRLTGFERRELTERLAEFMPEGKSLVIGVGGESTRQAREYARHAAEAGATAVMAIPPISSRLSETQLYEYFLELTRAVELPVIVQDASSYVGQVIPHSVCVALLDEVGPERVLFKPEAAPLGPNVSALREASGGRARILEGSGGIALVDSYRRGIVGTMPAVDLLPAVVALWQALRQGNDAAIYPLYFPIAALVAVQLQAGLDGFLAIEKHLLHRQGLIETVVRRRPYGWEMDRETREEVDRLFAEVERARQAWGSA